MPSIKLVVARRNRALAARTLPLLRVTLVALTASVLMAACAEGIPPEETATPILIAPTGTLAPPFVPTPQPTPTAVPFEPASSLAGARAFLASGLYPQALASFELVASEAASPELAAEAQTGSAVALHEMDRDDESIVMLRVAIATAPSGSGTAERASYLLGVRLAGQEEYAQSADALRELVANPGGSVLQHYVDIQFAASAAAAGNADDATGVWDLLLIDPGLPRNLRERIFADRAALGIEDGNTEAALGWLAESAELTGDAETRYRLALLAKGAGDTGTFADNLVSIIRESPSSTYALLAVAELKLADEPVDAGLVGLVFYRHREYASARETLEVAVEESSLSVAHLSFRTYYLAAANEDDGLLIPAVVLYDRAASYDPTSQYTHRAHYWAARVSEDLGRYEEASERYHRLVASGPDGPFTAESRFRAGYTLYLSGEFAAAVSEWVTLPGSPDARTQYWNARSLQASGLTAEATAAFRSAQELGPRTFYGMQAARALTDSPVADVSFAGPVEVAPIDWDAAADWVANYQAGGWVDAGATAAVELAAIGLPDAARSLLGSVAGSSTDPWVLLTVAREADRAALSDVVIAMTYRLLRAVSVSAADAPPEIARLLYPVSYVETLNARGEEFLVDPLFMAALIRQESLWNADAVSVANAMGLTQVIEPTGYSIAASLGLETFHPSDLFRPSVSIQFGALYIGSQLARFGDPHHALAAYNGGPENAAAWSARAPSPPADFVAEVEFSETRRYVELVMEHYAWYRFLHR